PSQKTEAILLEQISQPQAAFDGVDISAISAQLKHEADTQTARLAELAAEKVATERAKAGGQSSGKTMLIMAETMREVQQGTRKRTKKRWVKVVASVTAAALAVVAAMAVVIVHQGRQIARLVRTKDNLGGEIREVEQSMAAEADREKFDGLEERVGQLAGK